MLYVYFGPLWGLVGLSGIFLLLVVVKRLAWAFSAETLSILVIEVFIFAMSLKKVREGGREIRCCVCLLFMSGCPSLGCISPLCITP